MGSGIALGPRGSRVVVAVYASANSVPGREFGILDRRVRRYSICSGISADTAGGTVVDEYII